VFVLPEGFMALFEFVLLWRYYTTARGGCQCSV